MKKWKTTDEKLEFIDKLEEVAYLSNEHWAMIETLYKDEDSEVRLRISKILALFPSEEGERYLLKMRKDPKYLVRASVCDSLSYSQSSNSVKALIDSAKDYHSLVRGYAVLSLGDIHHNINAESTVTLIEFLKRLYDKESNEWVKIAIARSLFLLGERSFGTILLSMVHSECYRNRCFTINLLKGLIESNPDYKMSGMESILKHRLEIENAHSVKLNITRLLEVLHV